MSAKKSVKRAVKAVWDEVKTLRSERAKLYAPAEIAASAEQLAEKAGALKELSKQLSALSAMPPAAAKAVKAKRKDRPAAD